MTSRLLQLLLGSHACALGSLGRVPPVLPPEGSELAAPLATLPGSDCGLGPSTRFPDGSTGVLDDGPEAQRRPHLPRG